MIVKMKKIFLILLDLKRREYLKKLKELGVVHLEEQKGMSDHLSVLKEQKTILEKSFSLLPVSKEEGKNVLSGFEKTLELSKRVITQSDDIKNLNEEIESLTSDAEKLAYWGDFNPEEIIFLEEQGINISLFELTEKEFSEFPESAYKFIINKKKGSLFIAAVLPENSDPVKFDSVILPDISYSKIRRLIEEKSQIKIAKEKEITTLAEEKDSISAAITRLDEEIEFEEVRSGIGLDEGLAYLTGYVPVGKVDVLKKSAADNGWAVLVKDPEEEDVVPTLVKTSKAVGIIQPVFDMLGTIPGYKEKDISFFFLIFLSLFFAMIIGDAGYGAILVIVSALGLIKSAKDSPKDGLVLLMVMSVVTVIWGAVTGTWFGSKILAESKALSWMIIEPLSSFDPKSSQTVKFMCFIIGTVQISIAHIWNFIRELKQKPVIKAFAQLGWLSLVLGLYYLVLNIVLSAEKYPMPQFSLWMMICGFVFIVLFAQQENSFIKGVLKGANPMTLLTLFLDSISAFSDIISYIRLFAVGLASVEIAKSFNAMASGLGDGTAGIIGGIAILILGHTLNLAMGGLSVIVHGVRLNMLEFSGHLGIEWTGIAYKPFKGSIDV